MSTTAEIVILLGAPGAGKGTQAKRLARSLGVPHVSTGDLFRENLSQGTELGRRAREFMDRGALVPDSLVLDMLFDRVSAEDCRAGYVLDGFPRTVAQARALDERLEPLIEAGQARITTIDLAVDDDTIVRRLTGRLTCRQCGNIHHLDFAPPAAAGVCDACGGALEQRSDDTEAVVRNRLAVYSEQTLPVVAHYASTGALETVDGEQPADDVYAALLRSLGLSEKGA